LAASSSEQAAPARAAALKQNFLLTLLINYRPYFFVESSRAEIPCKTLRQASSPRKRIESPIELSDTHYCEQSEGIHHEIDLGLIV
jgi:hypothetical protein